MFMGHLPDQNKVMTMMMMIYVTCLQHAQLFLSLRSFKNESYNCTVAYIVRGTYVHAEITNNHAQIWVDDIYTSLFIDR